MKTKLDRRRKYFMILDCETATLPYAATIKNPEAKKKVAIAKPLIYDLGWTIIDKKGNIYKRQSFLISEIFSVPAVFNTGYYACKRPIYLERLRNNEISLVTWEHATAELEKDLSLVEATGAYNSMFDFKKAICFTELYISMLYSDNFYQWEKMQNSYCEEIARNTPYKSTKHFEPDIFRFRNKVYPLFDVWGLTCKYLINNDKYKTFCCENGYQSATGKYFPTSAEITFKFCANDFDFEEEHTALADAEIESFLFAQAVKKNKNKVEYGITFFPFRELGTVENFLAKMDGVF